jgi:hypothetical protein
MDNLIFWSVCISVLILIIFIFFGKWYYSVIISLCLFGYYYLRGKETLDEFYQTALTETSQNLVSFTLERKGFNLPKNQEEVCTWIRENHITSCTNVKKVTILGRTITYEGLPESTFWIESENYEKAKSFASKEYIVVAIASDNTCAFLSPFGKIISNSKTKKDWTTAKYYYNTKKIFGDY